MICCQAHYKPDSDLYSAFVTSLEWQLFHWYCRSLCDHSLGFWKGASPQICRPPFSQGIFLESHCLACRFTHTACAAPYDRILCKIWMAFPLGSLSVSFSPCQLAKPPDIHIYDGHLQQTLNCLSKTGRSVAKNHRCLVLISSHLPFTSGDTGPSWTVSRASSSALSFFKWSFPLPDQLLLKTGPFLLLLLLPLLHCQVTHFQCETSFSFTLSGPFPGPLKGILTVCPQHQSTKQLIHLMQGESIQGPQRGVLAYISCIMVE